MYHAMRVDNESRTTKSIAQTRTTTSLESLIDNALKRKLRRSTNVNRMLNVDVAQEIVITNHLVKRSRFDKASTSMKSSTEEASVSQTSNEIQAKFEEKL